MKRMVLALLALAAFASFGMTDTERQYLRNLAQRPRCESRKTVVIGGVTNVVETWRRGEYEWRQTNAVRRVIGKVQTNTFEQRLAEMKETVVFYESPHRLAKTLVMMQSFFAEDTPISMSRELTKIHEENFRGTLADAIAHFPVDKEVKGEIVVVVGGRS